MAATTTAPTAARPTAATRPSGGNPHPPGRGKRPFGAHHVLAKRRRYGWPLVLEGGDRVMRLAVAAACAVPAILAMAAGAIAQEAFEHPSCIAATLPAARAQTRLIPAEIKGPSLGQVRGVVVRSLTWRRGETIKVCFISGSRKAQERVARIAREWMQYANVTFDFEENGVPRTCKGDNSEDIKVTFE